MPSRTARGILGAISGGAQGAMNVLANQEKTAAELRKEKALEQRMINMEKLRAKHQSEYQTKGQAFTTSENDRVQGIKDEKDALKVIADDKKHDERKAIIDAEKQAEIIREQKQHDRREKASDKKKAAALEKDREEWKRRLQEKADAPITQKKNYNLMVEVLGEKKAKTYYEAGLLVKKNKDDFGKQKLWNDVFQDYLKNSGGELGEITPEIEQKAMIIATKISGFNPNKKNVVDYSQFGKGEKQSGGKKEQTPLLKSSDEPKQSIEEEDKESPQKGIAAPKEKATKLPANPKEWKTEWVETGPNQGYSAVMDNDGNKRRMTPDEIVLYQKTIRGEPGKSVGLGESIISGINKFHDFQKGTISKPNGLLAKQ